VSLAQVLSTYVNINLLIVIGFVGLGLFSIVTKKIKMRMDAGLELKLHYGLLIMILAFTVFHPFLPRNEIFSPAAKVWSAQSIKSFGEDYAASDKGGYLSLPTPMGTSILQADQVAVIWIILATLLLILGSLFIVRDLRILFKTKQNSFPIRKIGRVHIFISDVNQVPFSYWLPGQANIVVPSSLVERREDYKMAIAHELQHHRHGDTRWVYIMWGLRLICIINPAIHFWNRWISEIQEFACDETLVDQNKVESQAYARCLVEVAQSAIDQKYVPVCATGLTFLVERNILKRRIEKMLTKSSNRIGRSANMRIGVSVGVLIASIMGATAFASKGLVQDRRVNITQAKAMAIRAQSETGFPVVVNDLVLKQLNRYIGTPEGREFMRNSLARMENYKVLVRDQIQKYGLPAELMAMPLIESGYQNLPESKNSAWPTWKAAGVWQFIRETARNYGLVVNEKRDDRLNVDLLTDAAMRYLQSNNLRFKNWHLATLAYNMGENAVQKGLDALGTRDAWELIRNGHEGDKDYLPKLMAAILIMRNPDSVE
jgi:beta-lactamase regulating signal transducer with metallopeptidase domain